MIDPRAGDPLYIAGPEPVIRERPRWPLILAIVVVIGAVVAVSFLSLVPPVRGAVLISEGVETVIADPLVGLPDTATSVRGTATWCAPTPTHCQSWGGKARLGAMQSFRWGDKPYSVRVCRVGGRCTVVRVVSFCACGNTLIDLSPFAFRQLAPLSRGRIHVTVERISTPGLPVLPPTDTEGSR